MRLVHQLECQGFELELDPNGVAVSPVELITDDIRQWVREHRAEIIAELEHRERMRVAWFYKGLSKEQITRMMDITQTRDSSQDDRRSCVECLHSFVTQGRIKCQAKLSPIGHSTIYTLHRCRGFRSNGLASPISNKL